MIIPTSVSIEKHSYLTEDSSRVYNECKNANQHCMGNHKSRVTSPLLPSPFSSHGQKL